MGLASSAVKHKHRQKLHAEESIQTRVQHILPSGHPQKLMQGAAMGHHTCVSTHGQNAGLQVHLNHSAIVAGKEAQMLFAVTRTQVLKGAQKAICQIDLKDVQSLAAMSLKDNFTCLKNCPILLVVSAGLLSL